ncbi:MAG: hypothetical protein KAH24_10275, partial [Holophagae bacterium]|nr:hypothetical protein [Holophagae bacterium]
DVDVMIDDYCERFYGPAANEITAVLADAEPRVRPLGLLGAETDMRVTSKDIWGDAFPPEALKVYRQAADRAVEMTRGTQYAEAADLFSRYFVGAMEKGASQYDTFMEHTVYDGIPRFWKFRTDPDGIGIKEKWFGGKVDSTWGKRISINTDWTKQYDYHGVAWYGIELHLPEKVLDRMMEEKTFFFFRGVDGYAKFYLNGQKIGEQKEPPSKMWNTPYTIAIPGSLLNRDAGNTLVVRVKKDSLAAGIHKAVSIIDIPVSGRD